MAASDQLDLSNGLDREALLRQLHESKLLAAEEIDRITNQDTGATGADLAAVFLDTGLLTRYQIEAIAAGKHADLRIGNYDVVDRLGAGGMGTVFKARHRRMKRIVALKVLLKNLSQDRIFIDRFQREVETIAQLSHPNIVMAYDADEADIGHFLVMEFVSGQDLASVVHKQGPLSILVAVDCMLQAARGLAYAHGQNIIHRDIKPANLLRDANGVVKVTDLGLARLNPSTTAGDQTAAAGITQAGGILGTADYMPPEQAIDSTTIDHRADIYSLGATLYYLLAGKSPYTANSIMAILLKHREAPIPSLCQERPEAPAELDEMFHRMMAKDPRDRFQTMSKVVLGLERLLTSLSGTTAVTPALVPAPLPHSERPTETSQDLTRTVVGGAQAANVPAPIVLLVEPSRTQAGIIRKYLQSLDLMNVVSVANGAEALKATQAQKPDVIITAMHLNDMTGRQLADRVRDGTAAPPGIVLISSEADATTADTMSQMAILHKPFTAESLMQALKVASRIFANLKPPSTPSVVLPKLAAPNRGQCRVLIVDDSSAARLHVRKVLAGLGLVQCVEAGDGAQAVAVLAREKIDLIVTDYHMPLMDGRGLVGYIRQNPATAQVPIIMVTTETDPSKLESMRQLGVTVCEKSFPPDAARKIIDGFLKT